MTGGHSFGIMTAMTHRYTLVLEREAEGGYHVFCPALPGCHSQGETVDEAIANGTEAIEVYLESLIAHQEPLPVYSIVRKAAMPSICASPTAGAL